MGSEQASESEKLPGQAQGQEQGSCKHDLVIIVHKELTEVTYWRDDQGEYHEYKDAIIDSSRESARCKHCGVSLDPNDI